MLRSDLRIHSRYGEDSPAPISGTVAGGNGPSALEPGRTYTEVPNFAATPAGVIQAAGADQMLGHPDNPIWLMAPGPAKPRQVLP